MRNALLRSVQREANGAWRLQFHHEGSTHSLTALQLIDASGRRAALGRKLGAQRNVVDRLIGLTVYVSCETTRVSSQTILIEAAPDGWWYSTPLPGDRAVITFMTDADLVRSDGESIPKAFARKFSQTKYVRARFPELSKLPPVHINSAQSQTLSPCVDRDWVAAGDAAASYDPLSSLGIGHAVLSGIQAARIAHERLNGNESLADAYGGDVARNYAAYRTRLTALYDAERRWPAQLFWSRRQRQLELPNGEGSSLAIITDLC
jgi:flavin-dependent dehydrogenase